METVRLLQRLVYLDIDFISSYYECESGQPSSTQFARQEGKKAGAQIPLFSAELSAVETKTFQISSLGMLQKVLPKLDEYSDVDLGALEGTKHTEYGWINGQLSTAITTNYTTKNGERAVTDEERNFTLVRPTTSLALITSEGYFASGWSTLPRIQVLLKDFSLTVRAFVRTLPSITHAKHRVAVPLLMLEADHE